MSERAHLHKAFCPLDCPDLCSLEVEVADGRLTAVRGDERNPVTQGFVCSKVAHFHRHVYAPERMLYPGLRDAAKGSGRFRRVSWDEALGVVAERLGQVASRSGAEAILPFYYGGSNGLLTQDTVDARLFRRLGASRLDPTVCAAATSRAYAELYGKLPGVAPGDFVHSRLIIVWGANPSVSSIHLVPYLQEAQKRGARLVVVDPRRIPVARQADLHLAVRPGGDLPLALGLIRWLFENGGADEDFLADHCSGVDELRRAADRWTPAAAAEAAGVEADDLVRLAEWWAELSPAVVRCGWGPERNRNGGSAIAAILALPAIAGKFGVRGGGFTQSNSTAWNLDRSAAVGAEEPPTRRLNMNRLGRFLLGEADPPIEALFVYNCNPVATLPDQQRVQRGLEREDLFTVVFDPMLTDTARYADVVLPATTFFEHREAQRGYGSFAFQSAPPVIEPVGESRPNHQVFLELCDRMGLSRDGDARDEGDFLDAAVDSEGRRPDLEAALAGPTVAASRWQTPPVAFVDAFPTTPDRKVRLFPPELDAKTRGGLYGFEPDPATEAAPLALISPATSRTISSTLGELYRKVAPLELHPGDAEARGLAEGDEARVFNELGEIRCPVKINRHLRRGVAFLPKGLWLHSGRDGKTVNALVPDTATDFADGACFNDVRVEVEKVR